jgi:hypothetical protein
MTDDSEQDRIDPLPPLGGFVASLLSIEPEEDDFYIQAVTVSTPIELDLLSGGGGVLALGASSSTQSIETSVLPVFHSLRVTLMVDEEGEDIGTGEVSDAVG